MEMQLRAFLTSAADGGEWSNSSPGRFTPGKRDNSTHSTGGWVGPRTDMGAVEKGNISCLFRESLPDSLDVQPHSPSLYRQSEEFKLRISSLRNFLRVKNLEQGIILEWI
jgi:hypothetical protein